MRACMRGCVCGCVCVYECVCVCVCLCLGLLWTIVAAKCPIVSQPATKCSCSVATFFGAMFWSQSPRCHLLWLDWIYHVVVKEGKSVLEHRDDLMRP